MKIEQYIIDDHNSGKLSEHQQKFRYAAASVRDVETVLNRLVNFQVAIPSWALGSGGTRFGRFSVGGEPRNLEEKMEDIGLLHSLNRSSGAISLHIPWDVPDSYDNIRILASQLGLRFDAMNSNTFQDQPGQELSYKYGSFQHVDRKVR